MKLLLIFSILFINGLCNNCNDLNDNINKIETPDYYWRNYVGDIPQDALPVGIHRNGLPIYVGQAYLEGHGVIVAQVSVGNPALETTIGGNSNNTLYNKILCTESRRNFYWLPVNATNFSDATFNRHLVIGGAEYGKLMYIGRIQSNNEVKIGKVIHTKHIYFVEDGKERTSGKYEVLMYCAANNYLNY